MEIHTPTEEENASALAELIAAQQKSKSRADAAADHLKTVTPLLIRVLRGDSGQPARVRAIIWSCWNGENIVGLCDELCGLDTDIADAVVALLAARAHLGGNADDLIRPILEESGEMDRCEAAADRCPPNCDFVYPIPRHSAANLRSIATTIEALKQRR